MIPGIKPIKLFTPWASLRFLFSLRHPLFAQDKPSNQITPKGAIIKADPAPPYLKNRIFVFFQPNTLAPKIGSLLAPFGKPSYIGPNFGHVELPNIGFYCVDITNGMSADSVIERLKKDSSVKTATKVKAESKLESSPIPNTINDSGVSFVLDEDRRPLNSVNIKFNYSASKQLVHHIISIVGKTFSRGQQDNYLVSLNEGVSAEKAVEFCWDKAR
jgi:hypothetical protein